MDANERDAVRARLLATFELFELGVEMMAANLRRQHPEAPPTRSNGCSRIG
jgi:hypothetical protein